MILQKLFTLKNKVIPSRDPNEKHRVSSTLELYFDLVYVITIATAIEGFTHAIYHGHLTHGLAQFAICYCTIWWTWLNYNSIASGFDDGSLRFRVLTMINMMGAIIMAIGVNEVFETDNYKVMLAGVLVIRFATIIMWLFISYNNAQYKRTAFSYALGLTIVLSLWIILIGFFHQYLYSYIWYLVIAELTVPLIAEHFNKTPWHPHHIAERYGLLVIIILGESLSALVKIIKPLMHTNHFYDQILPLSFFISILLLALFSIYFKMPFGKLCEIAKKNANKGNSKGLFFLNYGHFFIFISLAFIAIALELSTMSHAGIEGKNSYLTYFSLTIFMAVSIWVYLTSLIVIRNVITKNTNFSLLSYTIVNLLLISSIIWSYFNLNPYIAISLQAFAPVFMALAYKEDVHLELD